MFTYKDIGFRPIECDDLELIRKMHNNSSILMFLGDVTLVSPSQQILWWENMSASRNNVQYCICSLPSEDIIGVWRLQNLDSNNRACEVGLDIFPEHQQKGFGGKSYEMIFCYLFEHYNLHTLYLRVAEFNKKARSLYKKLGFKETGRIVESIFRHGKYWDNIVMCMTCDEHFKRDAKKESI
jgi:RimJ/RimL family protein N-acetyltransferase